MVAELETSPPEEGLLGAAEETLSEGAALLGSSTGAEEGSSAGALLGSAGALEGAEGSGAVVGCSQWLGSVQP